jgi:polygalacturonase
MKIDMKYIKQMYAFGLLVILSGLTLTSSFAQNKKLLTKEEVGAHSLPELIAPIHAPFDMPQLTRPKFPSFSLTVTPSKPEGQPLITKQIQDAIEEVHRRGGGTVIIPEGAWQTGRIILKSNVNLHISKGAELHFSGLVEDYLPAVFTRNEGVEVRSLGALIYAEGEENIAITGKGKLVGPPEQCQLKQQMIQVSVDKIDAKVPVCERVYDGKDGGPVFLPTFIGPINCKNVFIEGVTLEKSPFWNIVPVYCDQVIIRGITVNSIGIPRGDGIDIESSRNVLIEYCTLNCGDDCFTLKAGRGEDALRVNKPTENVVIRYCLSHNGHGGVTCGSETGSMIRNLYVHDSVFNGTRTGIRFKTRRPRGGGGENLYYERIRMIGTPVAIGWDMLGSSMHVGNLASRLPLREITPLTPVFRNIFIRELEIEQAGQFIQAFGIPENPITNVEIENATISVTKRLIQLHDVNHFTVRNVTINSPDNKISILDGRNILFD